MTIETILNSDMSVAYITDCATSPVEILHQLLKHENPLLEVLTVETVEGLFYSTHKVPECLSLLRNWVPPPHPLQACSPWRNLKNNAMSSLLKLLRNWLVELGGGGGVVIATSPNPPHSETHQQVP